MKQFIQTKQAPEAIGPYSQAVQANQMLFVSGQLPFVAETMTCVGETIEAQTKQSLLNVFAIVKAAGFEITDIVKCTVFLKDMNEFSKMNQVYASMFQDLKPARAAVEVARLPKDVKVEIEAIAIRS